jgi:hypothetical protein
MATEETSMKRRTVLTLCGTSAAGLAGCQSIGSDDGDQPSDSTSRRPQESPARDGATSTSTGQGPSTGTDIETTAPSDVAVEYVVRAGDVPDALQSVSVTLQVVFVSDTDEMGACLRETYEGPYKPTITPIATPERDACHRSATVTFDLTGGEFGASLGPVTAPGSFAAGHALIATDVTATTRNGGTAAVRGTGGHRASVVEGPPDSPYHVEFDLAPAPDGARYDYSLGSTLVEPETDTT